MIFTAQVKSPMRNDRSGPGGIANLFVGGPADQLKLVAVQFPQYQDSSFTEHDELAIHSSLGTPAEKRGGLAFCVNDFPGAGGS